MCYFVWRPLSTWVDSDFTRMIDAPSLFFLFQQVTKKWAVKRPMNEAMNIQSVHVYIPYTPHCLSLLLDIMQARRYLILCYGAESSISKGSSHDCTSVTVYFNWAELHTKSYNHSLIEMRAQLSLLPDLLTTAFLPCSTNFS